MKEKKERGLWELYEHDPEKADADIWGRKPEPVSRRGFLKKCGLTAMVMTLGSQIPFFRNMPSGFIPLALAEADEQTVIPGKEGLTVLNDRPLNAEPPAHLLDDKFTPKEKHFVRNNGLPPDKEEKPDPGTFSIEGEVHKPLKLYLADLKKNFKHHTYALQLECGGNGRAGFYPPAKGNQWKFGAVGCARYTGVRLKDVLEMAELKDSAIYTGYYGADLHLSGNPDKVSISRGTPIAKALEEHTLLTWEMNGEPLPHLHGFPLRLVSPGWPASTSPKWLNRIVIQNKVHDGMKMDRYRIPRYPVKPGAVVPQEDMIIIESMPVKSLITRPKTGTKAKFGEPFAVRGHAWAGDFSVKAMDVSIDFGATWIPAHLKGPANRYAWQRWNATLNFPTLGYYEVWARATDSEGKKQPMVVPGWNPSGYLNNAMHRIAVTVV
ncbi:MAG: molybdopterin containing oxidoreductase [Nitrospinaceae bacterium]|nr:MAG: molybdopterin containing oxidoreductase [Nitrospinaceae bacterium]